MSGNPGTAPDIRPLLRERFQQAEIPCTPAQEDQLQNYMELLLEWNEKMNLTAITEPEQVAEDKEGLMTMYNIGKNMAWMLKCLALGKEKGIDHPNNEKILTNFTRP